MAVERKIKFEYDGEILTFLGTLDKLWEEYPGAQIRKISYHPQAFEVSNWRNIPGFKGVYQISNRGVVRRAARQVQVGLHYKTLSEKIMQETDGVVHLKGINGKTGRYKVKHLLAITFNL